MGMRGYGQHPQHKIRGRGFWSMAETPTGDSQHTGALEMAPSWRYYLLRGPANMGCADYYRRRAIPTPLGATRENPAAYRARSHPSVVSLIGNYGNMFVRVRNCGALASSPQSHRRTARAGTNCSGFPPMKQRGTNQPPALTARTSLLPNRSVSAPKALLATGARNPEGSQPPAR